MIPTKTLLPRRQAHLLHRPRLVDRLLRHVDRALTLVSAPAGYGKTSLLVDFAHDAPFPVCWLALDPPDRDLHTFVEYLVATVRRRFPQFGASTLRVLTANASGSTGHIRTLAGAMVQDMLDHVPDFFVLILDDYHALDDSPEVNELLGTLLTYRPDHCHIILATRIAPGGLPIIQLTAKSRIAGIGTAHLTFTPGEIRAFLAKAHDIELSLEQAEELVAESEGWITAILLSTEAMWRGMRDSLAQAKTQKGPIYTYLADQVFGEQSPELCDFMLASSILQEMNETLCRDALGLVNAADTLREIERRGVFVTTVEDETTGVWYRYHHLFRDFLQMRLQTKDIARFCQLHQLAADWFETDEQWESAVAHRLPAGDLRAAAQTMDAGLTDLAASGRVKTLLAWYEAIPNTLRSEFPRLLLFAGRALFNLGRFDEALSLLNQAETMFIAQGEIERALFAALQQADVRFLWGKYADVLALAQKVLDQASDYPNSMAEAHRLAGSACLNLGRPEDALHHLRSSLALRRRLESLSNTAPVYMELSLALLRLGQLSEGWACQDKAVELYRQIGPSAQLAVLLNNVACERHYLIGDYAPALTYLSESLAVARSVGAPRPQGPLLC